MMKLYYFDIYGRAEPIRMLLTHAKVEFEDIRIDKEGQEKLKAEGKLEFGQIPVIEKPDGKWFSQSTAILRAIGSKHGYYPADPIEGWKADSIIDSIGDITTAFGKAKFETDAEKQKTLFIDLATKQIPHWFTVLDKRIAANGSKHHIVGDKWTIADIALAAFFSQLPYNEANEHHVAIKGILETHEHLKHYAEHLMHEFADYIAKRPSPRPY